MMTPTSYTDDPQSTEATLPLGQPIFTSMDSAILIALSCAGCFTNMCVILTLVSSKSLKVRSNWILVIHQSFTDFISSGFVLISYVIIRVLQSHVEGWYGALYCKLIWSEYLSFLGFYASALNMTGLAVERFVMVVFPSIYREASLANNKVKIIIGVIWASSILMALPTGSSAKIDDDSFCHFGFFMGSMRLHQVYTILISLITFYIPVSLMAMCYSYIFRVVRSRNRRLHPETGSNQSKLSKSHMNLIVTSALMTSLFIVTWTPNQLYHTLYSVGYSLSYNDKWYLLSLMVVQLSSCLNPFIYVLKIKELRAAMLRAPKCVVRKTSVMDLAVVGRSIMDSGSHI